MSGRILYTKLNDNLVWFRCIWVSWLYKLRFCSIFVWTYSPASCFCMWLQLWRKRIVCVWMFLWPGLVAVGKPSLPQLLQVNTHKDTEHLLYILKHAASLRRWKENVFFLSAAETLLRSLLNVNVLCCVVICMLVQMQWGKMIMNILTDD